MKTGHKHGRRSAPRHRWQEKWMPHRLNERPQRMQVFRVKPDHGRLPIVEVRLTRTRRDMYVALWHDGQAVLGACDTLGLCRSWRKQIEVGHNHDTPRRPRLDWRHAVARIYLNRHDLLRHDGAQTIAHESGHAAMAWARYRGVNMSTIDGEETMAYALGRIASQINYHLHARGAWKR